MAGLSGYEIYQLAAQGQTPEALNRAADASAQSRERIQKLAEELLQLTRNMQSNWKGKASDNAVQAAQPIEQALRRAQETLDKADASLRAQAQNYGTFRQQVLPMATPTPPELNLLDQITPWDTDNEAARKEWFEADAQNRRAYESYAGLTGQNQATLPQMSQAPGGAPAPDTGVHASSGPGVKSSTASPQVKDAGTTSAAGAPESASAADKAAAPPSMGGGDKTSASNAGAPGGSGAQMPTLPGPAAPKQPGDRTTVADMSGGMPGALPLMPRPQSGNDSAHKPGVPKGDHLPGAGVSPMVPGGMSMGDPTGTRGLRGSLDPADRSAVVGKTLNAPTAAGARGAASKVGATGMGGFGAPAAHGREEEDKEHKRTVFLEEAADAIVGQLPGTTAPVIGED
ncbi:WXG100 family type VII secretion target [Lentzea sp. NPDC005914]|uniref:WXG100 family type VII secretion target n=1 Tax=Lentzea sp. NPDC005914 TaxID=3154572 RepID=UPI0034041A4A